MLKAGLTLKSLKLFFKDESKNTPNTKTRLLLLLRCPFWFPSQKLALWPAPALRALVCKGKLSWWWREAPLPSEPSLKKGCTFPSPTPLPAVTPAGKAPLENPKKQTQHGLGSGRSRKQEPTQELPPSWVYWGTVDSHLLPPMSETGQDMPKARAGT